MDKAERLRLAAEAHNDVMLMHAAKGRNAWYEVRNRILTQPPEYHALRHDIFMRERRKQEERYQKRDNNQSRLLCGCVVQHGEYHEGNYRTTVVHFCPTHWKERKRA